MLNNDLDFFNRVLVRASFGRFELRKSKNDVYYLYDFDDKEIVRNKAEIKDIIDCQNLYHFINTEDEQKLDNIFRELKVVGVYE